MSNILRSWIASMIGEDLLQAVTCRIRLWLKFQSLNRAVYNKLYKQQPLTVQTGPFKGLLYTRDLVWGIISNKWLGTYEAELHDVVEEIVASHYNAIIDVGCAEGWYAVGLACRIQDTKVYVYDRDPISLRQCQHLAKINGVEHRIIHGTEFTPQSLPIKETDHTLLICDVEGAETTLLNPAQSPSLLQMDVLVEIHEPDPSKQQFADLLKDRFCHSHQIVTILPYSNRGEKLTSGHEALVTQLGKPLFLQAVDEHRAPGNHWLWMKRLLD